MTGLHACLKVLKRVMMKMPFLTSTSARPGLLFRGGKNVLEESCDTKSGSLFHTLCYQNQLDNVSRKTDGIFCEKGRAESKFQETSPLLQRKKQDILQSIYPALAKSWRPVIQGWQLPPHATPWLRA